MEIYSAPTSLYLHSSFSSKLPLEVIERAVINSLKLMQPSCAKKKKKCNKDIDKKIGNMLKMKSEGSQKRVKPNSGVTFSTSILRNYKRV